MSAAQTHVDHSHPYKHTCLVPLPLYCKLLFILGSTHICANRLIYSPCGDFEKCLPRESNFGHFSMLSMLL